MKRMIVLLTMCAIIFSQFPSYVTASEDIDEIEAALTNGDFETISESLSTLPGAEDVLEKVNAVLEIQDDLTYVVDDFEGKTWIYYGDVTNISKTTYGSNVIPYIYMGSGTTIYKVGFTSKDWLFFNEIRIKLDDGEIIDHTFSSTDLTRDVISGTMVYEASSVFMDYDELEQISNSVGFTIRFQSDDYYLDYEKSKIMTDRFVGIKTVKDAYDAVSDYIS